MTTIILLRDINEASRDDLRYLLHATVCETATAAHRRAKQPKSPRFESLNEVVVSETKNGLRAPRMYAYAPISLSMSDALDLTFIFKLIREI